MSTHTCLARTSRLATQGARGAQASWPLKAMSRAPLRAGALTVVAIICCPYDAATTTINPPRVAIPHSSDLWAALRVRGGLFGALDDGQGDHLSYHEQSVRRDRKKMYLACAAIVSTWVLSGTCFYSWYNDWPLAQSFFYAVDAGMSIGFCTDVKETQVASRAFTIIYIFLGASCVGGALALFIEDIMEGAAHTANREYKLLLEQNAFRRADKEKNGVLSFEEFRDLIVQTGYSLEEEEFQKLCRKFDRSGDGLIRYNDFIHRYRGINNLIFASGWLYSDNGFKRAIAQLWEFLKQSWSMEHRIFFVFSLWIALGVTWGIVDQKWDPITATHFAVSALATGGLTAPPVDGNGILPASSAMFCGMYCLLGIPLFALTLGHFARVLVVGHVKEAEQEAILKPLGLDEFELAKSLCSTDENVHLSDFIVLQLLRQGKISVETINTIKEQFKHLDKDSSGRLNLDQATERH